MPAFSSFLAWDALINPGWILLGTAMAVHSLWAPSMSRSRKLGIGGYFAFGALLIVGSWWRGAVQVEQANTLARAANVQPNQSVETVIGAAAAKFSELQTTLADTQHELSVLRAGLQPRIIDEKTAAGMISALSAAGSHEFAIRNDSPNDEEAFRYLNRITEIFKHSGWSEIPDQPEVLAIIGRPPEIGLLVCTESGKVTPLANVLASVFTRSNIEYNKALYKCGNGIKLNGDNSIGIAIGKKPEKPVAG